MVKIIIKIFDFSLILDYKVKIKFCYQKENGFYAYKADCSKYVYCSNGYKYIMPCPKGLWFDTSTETCKQPKIAVNSECRGEFFP